ncbi:hypothetical protein [Streptomyces sp. NPDC007070]|uniref:hypothetical protein n=1 Tax=Streptomyces sp. NPDC007070 TaxID=3154312 RepID=UPI0033CE4DE7
MRITRTLFTSAAVATAVALSAPGAGAVTAATLSGAVSHTAGVAAKGDSDDHGSDDDSDDHGSDRGGRGGDDHGSDEGGRGGKDHGGSDEGGHGKDKPRGGVHAGGGFLAQDSNSMGAGAALVLGGLGVGAYMLRRRRTADGSAA